ncbi:MAG: pilus assembly protein PilM [Phycisphaerales bacterium]
MARGKPKLFICIGHQSIGVLELDGAKADRAGQASLKTRVARTLRIPHDIDPANERDLASWLAASLEQAGCSSKGATLVLERSDVVAKRLKLEGVERGDVDLPGMVRYQLMRQVAFQTDEAPIDFMLLQPKVRSLKEVTGEAEVLAATAPIARVDHLRKVCEEAGLDVQRIAVLSLGLAEIAASAMADRVGPTLVIAPTLDGIDYSIHQAGRVLSSRWIETQHRTSEQDLTELVVSEARRTRMSHQLTPDSDAIHSALIISEPGGVFGDDEEIATRVGDVLGVITEVVDPLSAVAVRERGMGVRAVAGAHRPRHRVRESIIGHRWPDAPDRPRPPDQARRQVRGCASADHGGDPPAHRLPRRREVVRQPEGAIGRGGYRCPSASPTEGAGHVPRGYPPARRRRVPASVERCQSFTAGAPRAGHRPAPVERGGPGQVVLMGCAGAR